MLLAFGLLLVSGGCGGSGSESEPPPTDPQPEVPSVRPEPVDQVLEVKPEDNDPKTEVVEPKSEFQVPPRILGDLVTGGEAENAYVPSRLPVDDDRVMLHGIRKLTSKHLVLYTDLPASPDVDELPAVFDLAVPEWCEYFQIERDKVADWQMTAFIVKDKTKFRAAAIFPDELPPFEFGFQLGWELWLYEQLTDEGEPAVYYRRHLLLHEGTHGFMNFFLKGAGALWYMEGMAELLATHLWDGETLTLNYLPRSNDELPHWGRVKLIRDDYAANQGVTLSQIMQLRSDGQLDTRTYAWCWAAATFFDNHPRYRDRFKALQKKTADRTDTFTLAFLEQIKEDESEISEEWLLFIMELEYGSDVARAAVQYKPGQPLPPAGASVEIAADRGWQSTGIVLEAGNTYQITASGRYQIGDAPKIWWCEPNGVTIDYYRGQPLGMLMGAIRTDENPLAGGISALATPVPIGLAMQTKPTSSGTLYLRINESPAQLHDNAGVLTVNVAQQP